MNDRFKFRAWNKESKRIFDVRELGFMRDTLEMGHICLDKPGNDYYGIEIESVEEYIVMQCTGLKDKNGRLIYEGDIVEYTSLPSKQHKDERIKPSTINFKVVRVEKYAQYQLQNAAGVNCIHISTAINQLEVIGNIYENPELLEVGK